jgi:hypothetical protein
MSHYCNAIKVHLVCSTLLNISIKTWGVMMKTKTLVCVLVFFVVVLTIVGSYASDKEKYGFYVPNTKKELYGT